jgi:hypothetical protein
MGKISLAEIARLGNSDEIVIIITQTYNQE